MRQTFFTGNKNIDSIILNKLTDPEILKVGICGTYGKELCDYEGLWYNRLINKFPSFLEFKDKGTSAKNYYIKIIKSVTEVLRKWDYIEVNYGDAIDVKMVDLDSVNESLLEKLSQSDKNNALLWASLSGYLEVVKYLFQNGAHIYDDDRDISSLCLASAEGHLEIVKYFVQNGADIQIDDNRALKDAVEGGYLEVVKYLVQNGANIHAQDDAPLRWSASHGHLEVVKYLVQNGANVHAGDDAPLKEASSGGYLEMIKYLVQNGADIRTDNDYALRVSCFRGYLEVVKYTVQNGADIHIWKDIPLQDASMNGHLEIVKYLVQNGASTDGYDPLILASVRNRIEIVKYLVQNGAKINRDLFMRGAYGCASDTTKYLVEKFGDSHKIYSRLN